MQRPGSIRVSIAILLTCLTCLLLIVTGSSEHEHATDTASTGQCYSDNSSEASSCQADDEQQQRNLQSALPPDFVDPCTDSEPRCPLWALQGECRNNPNYMLFQCARSCGTCQPFVTPQEEVDSSVLQDVPVCEDDHQECSTEWEADIGECLINPDFMLTHCKYSCWKCVNPQKDRELGISEDIIAKKLRYLKEVFPGKAQLVRAVNTDDDGAESPMTEYDREEVLNVLRKMDYYSKHILTEPHVHMKARERCRNEFRMCAEWAARGKCFPVGHPLATTHVQRDHVEDENASPSFVGGSSSDVLFMMNVCPLACRTCELIPSLACAGKRHPHSEPSFDNGEIRQFFENLREKVGDEGNGAGKKKSIFVSYPNGEEEESKHDSYVVVLPNFVSEQEIQSILSLVSTNGWASYNSTSSRGGAVDDNNGQYVVNVAKCLGNEKCSSSDSSSDSELYHQIMERIVSLTNTSISYIEPIEILQFGVKIASTEHQVDRSLQLQHNYQISDVWKPAGPRVLSLLIFLSDNNDVTSNVDATTVEGGGIGLPHLDWLILKPIKGTAVLWSNVLNENVWEMDPLMSFENFPLKVKGGEDDWVYSHVANVHVRLYNSTDASYRGCA